MNKNGSNGCTRKNVGEIKIGKWNCPNCRKNMESEKKFWTQFVIELELCMMEINRFCINNGMSYRAVEGLCDKLVPISDESIRLKLKLHDGKIHHPELRDDVFIIHYDEQHPKKATTQKFRLTIMDGRTGIPIADDLCDDKSPETIKAFFRKHLDLTRKYFIVTDLGKSYPEIFKELFPNGYTHQFCLLHLQKLIVNDFKQHYGRNMSFEIMAKMYSLLDILYDHSEEIAVLKHLSIQEKELQGIPKKLFKKRISELRREWHSFHKALKNLHRKTGVPMRSFQESIDRYNDLVNSTSMNAPFIRTRLSLIKKYWPNLMAYHTEKNAPATNNMVENYYSSTLKQQRKKQYRTDEGLQNLFNRKIMEFSPASIYTGRHIFDIIEDFRTISRMSV
jgi:hypothetical protein